MLSSTVLVLCLFFTKMFLFQRQIVHEPWFGVGEGKKESFPAQGPRTTAVPRLRDRDRDFSLNWEREAGSCPVPSSLSMKMISHKERSKLHYAKEGCLHVCFSCILGSLGPKPPLISFWSSAIQCHILALTGPVLLINIMNLVNFLICFDKVKELT